jgi:hypothetical protein
MGALLPWPYAPWALLRRSTITGVSPCKVQCCSAQSNKLTPQAQLQQILRQVRECVAGTASAAASCHVHAPKEFTAQHLARTAFFTSQSSVNLSNAPSTPCITTCRKHITTVRESEPRAGNPTPDDVEELSSGMSYVQCHTHRLPLSYVLPHVSWLGGTKVNSWHHGASATAAAANALSPLLLPALVPELLQLCPNG